MSAIRLIHWNEAEACERAARLTRCGYTVEWQVRPGPESLKELKTTRAGAIVIDLTRLPAQGRDVAIYLRRSKATRNLPIVFVGGEEAKVARVKQVLPDAVYTTWPDIERSLARALAQPPGERVVPASVFAPYADRPAAAKLGIRPGSVIAAVHAPADFPGLLGALPENVTLVSRLKGGVTLAIWFVRDRRELDARAGAVAARVVGFPIWIAWPKKVAGSSPDVGQQDVRRAGLAEGLVDYKICAIDATWSALLFRRRRADR